MKIKKIPFFSIALVFNRITFASRSFTLHSEELNSFSRLLLQNSAEMFARLKDPEARGDIFGFQKRALATTLRGCFGGAILQ